MCSSEIAFALSAVTFGKASKIKTHLRHLPKEGLNNKPQTMHAAADPFLARHGPDHAVVVGALLSLDFQHVVVRAFVMLLSCHA